MVKKNILYIVLMIMVTLSLTSCNVIHRLDTYVDYMDPESVQLIDLIGKSQSELLEMFGETILYEDDEMYLYMYEIEDSTNKFQVFARLGYESQKVECIFYIANFEDATLNEVQEMVEPIYQELLDFVGEDITYEGNDNKITDFLQAKTEISQGFYGTQFYNDEKRLLYMTLVIFEEDGILNGSLTIQDLGETEYEVGSR